MGAAAHDRAGGVLPYKFCCSSRDKTKCEDERVRVRVRVRARVRVRIRVRVRREILERERSGGRTRVDGSVTSRRYRLGLEEVFVFDSKSENRYRAVEAVESVSEASAV